MLDLRHVNKFLVAPSFKHEDLRTLSQMFKQDFGSFSWDFKSGYHHIDIYPPHRIFLCFALELDGKICLYFQFNVLPFGLSTACYSFTKLLCPLVRR